MVQAELTSKRYRAFLRLSASSVGIRLPTYSMYMPGSIFSFAKSPNPALERPTRIDVRGIVLVLRGIWCGAYHTILCRMRKTRAYVQGTAWYTRK